MGINGINRVMSGTRVNAESYLQSAGAKKSAGPVDVNSPDLPEKVNDTEKVQDPAQKEALISQVEGELRSVSDDGDELRVSKAAAGIEGSSMITAYLSDGNKADSLVAAGADGLVARVDNAPDKDSDTETDAVSQVKDENDTVDTDDDQITDLTGYTMSQIETLYYQGRVSRYDYEQEVKEHEELDEELGIGNGAEKTDSSAENVSKTMDQNKAANEALGNVAAKQINNQIQADALETAIGAGRADLMTSIFDKGNV